MQTFDLSSIWTSLPLAVFDLETTGLNKEEDRIIEIGVVHFSHGQVEKHFNWLINPERELPPKITEITGIKNEDLKGKPRLADIAQEVINSLSGRILVAFNFSFDVEFLSFQLQQLGVQWPPKDRIVIDPLIFARYKYYREKNRLVDVAARLGIPLTNAHRASHDAEATGHILYAMGKDLPQNLDSLLTIQQQWQIEVQEWDEVRFNRKRRDTIINQHVLSKRKDSKPSLSFGFLYGNEADPIKAYYSQVARLHKKPIV